jgi:MYXO-CTERM domain-containing protein
MSSTRFARQAAAAALLAATGAAQATVLTFETISQLGPSAGGTYGDRVTGAGPGLGTAGGPTPNIVLDFVPTSTSFPFSVYASGYSGLVSALGHNSFNIPGYVQLTPDAGWDVVLTSFDIGAWGGASYPDSRIQVVDTAGTVHFDSGVFTFPGNTVRSYLPEPIRSSLPLRLVVQDFGDLGLDNLQFSQVATVPEPGTWAMWLAGAAVLGGLARRRSSPAP